jgi:rubrerythrin
MFTLADICEIAIQIERNGEASYLLAAQKATDVQIAGLLHKLAEQEREHLRWFEQLDVGRVIAPKDDQMNRFGQDLLREMIGGQTFSLDSDQLGHAMQMKAVIAQSIEFEKDTIVFYEMLHNFLDDSETMQQLERVIDEERSHIERLNEITEKLNS